MKIKMYQLKNFKAHKGYYTFFIHIFLHFWSYSSLKCLFSYKNKLWKQSLKKSKVQKLSSIQNIFWHRFGLPNVINDY